MSTFDHTGWLLVALLILTWLISLAVRAVAARLRLAAHRRKQRRARVGEIDAVELLQRSGYVVVDSQVRGRWTVFVDDEPIEIELFADHLVERDGERLVAEVKTGDRAPSVRTAATRRQLLEYLHAFEVEGLLLVDMENEVAHRVEFRRRDAPVG